MNILVIGSGGREHALIWKINQNPKVKSIYAIPGNAGISQLAQCINYDPADFKNIINFAKEKQIDMTIVGPEVPLCLGIVDEFEKEGLAIFGPRKNAAILEGSKTFAKDLMNKYNIPTARYSTFTEISLAKAYVRELGIPIVIKADGLAAGKGVLICHTQDEADNALNTILQDKAFGEAGHKVLIEEFLEGEEASFLVFTDGKAIHPMASAQDHKAIYDQDKGPNTGGMGAYSPAPIINEKIFTKIMEKIIIPTVHAMASEGRLYKGVLYAGLMIKDEEPKVLEFNVRFGDPETQPIIQRMKTDIISIFDAVINENLINAQIEWDDRASVCVVLASQGYPGNYSKGLIISGLENFSDSADSTIFHAGTALKNGHIVTSGGRVLGVTSLGKNIEEAINNSYSAIGQIAFDGMYYRTDIGKKALRYQ